jgi:glucose/arabinose dehydrogenase
MSTDHFFQLGIVHSRREVTGRARPDATFSRLLVATCCLIAVLAGCSRGPETDVAPSRGPSTSGPARIVASAGAHTTWQSSGNIADDAPVPPFFVTDVAGFDEPWAMAFLPDGRVLISEKRGRLKLFDPASNHVREVAGVPAVAYEGQGGFGDVAVHPRFADNGLVYLSYVERGPAETMGAVVIRARLAFEAGGAGWLRDLQAIWHQDPKVAGAGHYSHRILFGPDGKLWISSGDRKRFDPAQDMTGNLGKIVRLNEDGGIPNDNPFAAEGGITAQIWSLGHRNVLGLAFDEAGRLWGAEMGPSGGDELNLIQRGSNYGYPLVSWGNHYDGQDMPDHDTRPEFAAPKVWWDPVISPSAMMIYSGDLFPYFKGNGFITGLSSGALIRIQFDGESAREVARYDMGSRMRAVNEGPGGEIWLLQDGPGARLLKLVPPVP